jgi:Asp-tRNA(Asn)/Glu-tRNA(Gln) amidotransferase B subunit
MVDNVIAVNPASVWSMIRGSVDFIDAKVGPYMALVYLMKRKGVDLSDCDTPQTEQLDRKVYFYGMN